ncbi:MAG: hypothetical protein BRC26_01525, partial [Nanohaloarchaea archaeon QH_8_44_6]
IPLIFISYTGGVANVGSMSGFEQLEPAGNWMDQNLPENANIVASSPSQTRYYAYPRMSYRAPDNETAFKQFVKEKNITYLSVDIYERTQPRWLQTKAAPYRLPNKISNQVRSGRISPQQAANVFESTPSYLKSIKTFGKTRLPLTKRTQPAVIVYKINRTALQ